jgi:putative spermidine/putrescine transport system substrate-binding protein
MLKQLATFALAFATATSVAAAADLKSMSWDDIVTQAKKEGEVTWFVWYLQDDLRNAVKPFEEKYGIKVIIPEGTEDGNNSKLLAEKEREAGDIDVMAISFNKFEDFGGVDTFENLSELLPETEGRVGELVGVDGKGHAYAFWGNQTGIAYDPGKVDEANLPQTPEEFAAFWASNPEKFGFNYEKGGSGPSFFQNTLRVLTDVDFTSGESSPEKLEGLKPGVDFFNTHAENYLITASNSDSITRVSDGELWMAPAWEDHLAGLQKRGEVRSDIKFYIPSMGMNGGGNGVAIPKNAPHKAAALVLTEWLTSADTQTAFNRDFGTAPMHDQADGKFALVPADQRRYRAAQAPQPFEKHVKEYFVENVVLER